MRDIVTLALPPGSRVVAGEEGLDGEVKWVCTIRSYPPLPEDVSAGDCALLAPVPAILTEDAQISLFDELASLGITAVGIVGDATGEVAALADECRLPLLTMPPGTRLNDVEKAIIALIFNRQAELEQRGVQIYRQMAQMITAGRGIGAIIDKLAEITGNTVTLQGADSSLRFHAGPLPAGLTLDDLRELLRDGRELRAWLEGTRLVSTAPPIGQLDLAAPGLARYVAPVIVRESIVGYVSVLGLKSALTELDHLATGRAASVCAIEMAKERAVVEAENKVRGDFLEDLLTGNFLTEEAAIRRGAVLGYDLSAPYVVTAIKPDGPTRFGSGKGKTDGDDVAALGQVVRQELSYRAPQSLMHVRKDAVVVLWPVAEGDTKRVEQSIESLRRYAETALSTGASAGIGRPCAGPETCRAVTERPARR